MSTDFEKALARAAAARSARDDEKAWQEHEHADNVRLAHSIINPYLALLGPQVVKSLRDLKIPPIGRDRFGHKHKLTDCWKFTYYSEYEDLDRSFTLNKRGRFGNESDNEESVFVGLIGGHIGAWIERTYGSRLVANLDDRRVYVQRDGDDNRIAAENLQELSEFIAEYIYSRMKP